MIRVRAKVMIRGQAGRAISNGARIWRLDLTTGLVIDYLGGAPLLGISGLLRLLGF